MPGAQYVRLAQPSSKSAQAPVSTSHFGSPCITKFETFLDEREAIIQKQTINKGSDKFVVYERPASDCFEQRMVEFCFDIRKTKTRRRQTVPAGASRRHSSRSKFFRRRHPHRGHTGNC
jgi:hypothetical protein